jgi:predicted metalloendopeptidase
MNGYQVAPAATVLPVEMLQNAEKYETEITAYREYIANVAELLERESETALGHLIELDAQKIVELEIKLAKVKGNYKFSKFCKLSTVHIL